MYCHVLPPWCRIMQTVSEKKYLFINDIKVILSKPKNVHQSVEFSRFPFDPSVRQVLKLSPCVVIADLGLRQLSDEHSARFGLFYRSQPCTAVIYRIYYHEKLCHCNQLESVNNDRQSGLPCFCLLLPSIYISIYFGSVSKSSDLLLSQQRI